MEQITSPPKINNSVRFSQKFRTIELFSLINQTIVHLRAFQRGKRDKSHGNKNLGLVSLDIISGEGTKISGTERRSDEPAIVTLFHNEDDVVWAQLDLV